MDSNVILEKMSEERAEEGKSQWEWRQKHCRREHTASFGPAPLLARDDIMQNKIEALDVQSPPCNSCLSQYLYLME